MKATKATRQAAKNASYRRRQKTRDEVYDEKKKAKGRKNVRTAERQHEIDLAKIDATKKTGIATAASTGATTLGLGLNAENNQDDQANRDALQARIDSILSHSSDIEDDTTGLKTATM